MRIYVFTFLLCAFTISLSAQTIYASYPFDGNVNDVSGNNQNGAMNGTITAAQDRYNVAGKAIRFDGATNYVDLPSEFDLATRSIVVWFNATQIPAGSNGGVVYNSDHTNIQNGATYILVNSDTANHIRLGVDNAIYNTTMDTGQWYQVVVVRNPTMAKFYVNGTLVYTSANPDGTHSANGANNAVVGADRLHNALFVGRIDDLVIYSDTLSAAQVAGNFSSLSQYHKLDDELRVFTEGGNAFYNMPEELTEEVRGIEVYDISGKLISAVTAAEVNGKLNSAAMPAGTYFASFRLKQTAKAVSRTFVIAR